MAKRLDIVLKDTSRTVSDYDLEYTNADRPRIFSWEISDLLKNRNNPDYECDELDKAIGTLVAKFNEEELWKMTIDISETNKKYASPPTEMTIEEIEEELGYKIKIVGKKTDI